MSRLECQKCKSVYQNVSRINRCPQCGRSDFWNADVWKTFRIGRHIMKFPNWMEKQSNMGFVYVRTLRMDDDRQI